MLVRVFVLIAIFGAVVTSMSTWRGDVPSLDGEIVTSTAAGAPGPRTSPSAATAHAPARAAAHPVTTATTASAPRPRMSRPQAFERSSDLFAFARQLQPAADAGDAEAQWLVSRVHEYCDGYTRAPVDYDRDTALIESLGLRAARPLGEARGRVAERCRRFGPGDTVGFLQLVQQRQAAADAGSLAAEAALLAMGEPVGADAHYRRDLVERVQASRDPEAYAALAPAMGIAAAEDVAMAGQIAGTRISEQAWRLAACRLGLDCSQKGALMTTYCANGGICARNDTQDFSAFVREAGLSPGEVDEVDHMVDVLVDGQNVGVVMR